MNIFFKFLRDKAIHHQANSIPANLGLPRHLWSSRQGQGQWRPGSPSLSSLKFLNDMSTIDLLGNPGQWWQWWSRQWGGRPACLVRPHRPHGRLDELCQGRVGHSISRRRSTLTFFLRELLLDLQVCDNKIFLDPPMVWVQRIHGARALRRQRPWRG